jgi:hypothetical protein
VIEDRVHILSEEISTCVSTITPHLAIALKKSVFERQPLLYKSKNLKALKRKAS